MNTLPIGSQDSTVDRVTGLEGVPVVGSKPNEVDGIFLINFSDRE